MVQIDLLHVHVVIKFVGYVVKLITILLIVVI